GSRWMTTFRKLPMNKPTSVAIAIATYGLSAIIAGASKETGASPRQTLTRAKPVLSKAAFAPKRSGRAANFALNHCAELEDGQIHRDHKPADDDAEKHDHDRLEQARKRGHRIVHFTFVEIGDLAQHVVERTGFFADLRHLQHHVGKEARVHHRVGEARTGA